MTTPTEFADEIANLFGGNGLSMNQIKAKVVELVEARDRQIAFSTAFADFESPKFDPFHD